ncbi:hypothetical protein JZ751_015652 [Albula glossodonta]|uniref:Uncharacterized protein n=1 Tax=Albula glossodonta TaxID=121402 RepID=A0A8T2NTB6_9TELE|nr:hypothetical protein JZ751_015652 [Albula glossodonta]
MLSRDLQPIAGLCLKEEQEDAVVWVCSSPHLGLPCSDLYGVHVCASEDILARPGSSLCLCHLGVVSEGGGRERGRAQGRECAAKPNPLPEPESLYKSVTVCMQQAHTTGSAAKPHCWAPSAHTQRQLSNDFSRASEHSRTNLLYGAPHSHGHEEYQIPLLRRNACYPSVSLQSPCCFHSEKSASTFLTFYSSPPAEIKIIQTTRLCSFLHTCYLSVQHPKGGLRRGVSVFSDRKEWVFTCWGWGFPMPACQKPVCFKSSVVRHIPARGVVPHLPSDGAAISPPVWRQAAPPVHRNVNKIGEWHWTMSCYAQLDWTMSCYAQLAWTRSGYAQLGCDKRLDPQALAGESTLPSHVRGAAQWLSAVKYDSTGKEQPTPGLSCDDIHTQHGYPSNATSEEKTPYFVVKCAIPGRGTAGNTGAARRHLQTENAGLKGTLFRRNLASKHIPAGGELNFAPQIHFRSRFPATCPSPFIRQKHRGQLLTLSTVAAAP